MWNAALRRIVRGEEDREHEKRAAGQLRLRREAQLEAKAAAAKAAAAVDLAESQQQPVDLVAAQDQGADNNNEEEEEEDDEDDAHVQRHLLTRAASSWSCVEDSQQAFCLALSRQRRVFAVGEREGRLSVWDNVAVRVITRELDPTLVQVPEHAAPAADGAGADEAASATGTGAGGEERGGGGEDVAGGSGEVTPEEGGDESATNDDGSVEADDDEEEEEEEEEDDEEEEEEEETRTAGEEDGEGNTEEDEDEDEDMDGDDEQEDEERGEDEEKKAAEGAQLAAATGNKNQAPAKAALPSGATATSATCVGGGGKSGAGLTLEELRIVKTALKVVTSCAWSCDTRWLFAGCEEKGNRRGRLCVWDVEAASIFATFSFDAAINCVSAHPGEPELVLVSSYNSLPVLLNFRTRTSTQLAVPTANPTINTTVPANSRHPSLVVSAKFGTTGNWIYCVTSKATVAIFDSKSLECLHSATLPVVIQFIDLSVDYRETALILTSSKGIHEFAIVKPDGEERSSKRTLAEVRLYSTGAVRAPWALCCFSDDESFVVGLPIVRHRHVGENGLYTWNRVSGKVQHNPGVKDGVNSLVWDSLRDAILAVSTTGSLYVLEEEFRTTWSGPMYPAGYRLITDNELHAAAVDAELAAIDKAKREAVPADEVIDIFTIDEEPTIGPSSAQRPPMPHLETRLEPEVKNELVYIPAIPIAHHHRKHHHHAFHGHTYNEEKHFGLGQSIFEPLKVPAKPKSSKSKKKKTPADPAANVVADGEPQAVAVTNKKKRVRSSSGSQKKRRR